MKDAAINGCDQIVSKAGEHAYQIRENKTISGTKG